MTDKHDQTHLLVDGDGQPSRGSGEASTIGTARADFPAIHGYEVLGRLGAGAMGEVYRARHLATGQEVALKIIARHLADQPEMAKRFEREIELLGKISHANIAAAVD